MLNSFRLRRKRSTVFKGRKCDLSRSESFLRTFCPFFVFLFVKYLCMPEMRLVIGYIYKKEDCDCRYFDGSNSAVAKIKSLKWDFESFDGVLFGRVRATLTEPLTEDEEA